MSLPVIDMRCRPAYLHDFFGAMPGSAANDVARWLNQRVGTRGDPEHYARSRTHEGFMAEIDDAGLSKAVVVGRHTPTQHLSNDRIHEIVRSDERLVGIGAVDPALLGPGTPDEVDRAVRQLGLAGIDIEPGFGAPARHADDPLYFPVYEQLSALGVPVFLMSGPTTPDHRFNDPAPLARVAAAFPKLRIVAYHGYWPNVQQLVGVAFRHENVFLVPDMYLFLPGSEVVVTAANQFLSDQVLFGSSYPFRPIRQSVEDAQRLGFKDDVLEKFLFQNAKRVLSMD
ncbi:amidohydrolase family protein [Azohydromonas caseinilytica]|uniref:Amidohydrolase family protein n=1 Tax=Azohydromonas caseinilytica TaxID=2728836 RepID=A0A848FI35_9BURK|nr:amidohydrolase family protein [Azohydromonas caseinilytica]NML18806.1 amidohydrolase family protein [Azohydromonas caseinilytica]